MAEFFAPWREARRRHYESRPPRSGNRSAVITMVHNEAVFLPIWLRYYSRYFGEDDIYVLDNETTDGSTERGGFVRIPVEHDSVDHAWMVHTIEDLQRELLDTYDVVLVTDVDEIVAPLPQWGTLDRYLDRFDEEFVMPLGFEILHRKEIEPPYDPARPVLEQRGFWFANDGYDKPVLTTEPALWEPGFHARVDRKRNWDPDLRLIHLHRMDYETCLERHRLRRARSWNGTDLEQRWATHNRIAEEAEFERWFYEDSNFEDIDLVVEPIPPEWRGLF